MANHNLPTLTSTYTNFITEIDARFDDAAMMYDPAFTTATNLATNAIRWSSAGGKWQKWSGTAWADLATTFSISISGNAGSVTNGIYSTGTYADPAWITSIAGSKVTGSISGNAGTVTNGVYTTGSYANPAWITSLAGSKVSGDIAGNAGTVTNGVYTTGSYSNPTWITGLAGSKISGAITGASGSVANALTFNNLGTGVISGTTYDGSTARIVSYNSIGAAPSAGATTITTLGTITAGTWSGSVIATAYTAAKVTDIQAGTGVTVSGTTGSVTVNAKVTDIQAGTGVTLSGTIGSVTVNIGQAVATTSNVQFNSIGVGTAASAVAGEIRATNNVTAYYSSDIMFKENVRPIDNALDKVLYIGGKLFDWKDSYISNRGGEDGYFIQKQDFGVIAQDVKEVFPVATRTRSDGSLVVDYEKLAALAFQAIVELKHEIDMLKNK